MAKKKSCAGCYAAIRKGHPLSDAPQTGCTLGCKCNKGIPEEECPKPKSWKELQKLGRSNL